SSAGDATLIANGGANSPGVIFFVDNSSGGSARVELFGNGRLDLILHQTPDLSVGSIEGTGVIFLGGNELKVGSNNLSTEFSGVIQVGNNLPNETGSLTKVGTGTLTLSGANTHTGVTTINDGGLLVNGSITSAVTVNGGLLGGTGTTGAVTINNGGVLSPGASPGILHVAGNLTLAMGSTYLVQLNGLTLGSQYDQTSVIGTVSLNGATLSLSLAFVPAIGAAFAIIDNDSTDAINGTFNGLPEGSTVAAGGQLFAITYAGGDGNDVIVRVVPEPATWTFLLLAALVAVTTSVRKRQRAG
ncbi:MAG: autotransporter-associated beta strand repeat-containing protein, partial [Verrucomicrobiota bacterium]|nr:autotransporter-associated beta strand repeat-containing protein [Verrucomicrobiota bacterium]